MRQKVFIARCILFTVFVIIYPASIFVHAQTSGKIWNGNSKADGSVHAMGNNGTTCAESNAVVEVTALYLLAARDYYNATHDLKTLKKVDKSLRFAMDVQLKEAIRNGYKLEFSGDETELCAAVDVSTTGFDRDLSKYWSMTSIALCSASLDFYIQYLKLNGINPVTYLNVQDNRKLNLYDELGNFKTTLETDFWHTDAPANPNGFHDAFRNKSTNSLPLAPIVNFTLFPIYYGTPMKYPERAGNDVASVLHYFNKTTGLLPLTGTSGGSLGHNLGYLLWGLVSIKDSVNAVIVYNALVNGSIVQCWGTFNEAYDASGLPNHNGLRTFETGVNISAIAKCWGLGNTTKYKSNFLLI